MEARANEQDSRSVQRTAPVAQSNVCAQSVPCALAASLGSLQQLHFAVPVDVEPGGVHLLADEPEAGPDWIVPNAHVPVDDRHPCEPGTPGVASGPVPLWLGPPAAEPGALRDDWMRLPIVDGDGGYRRRPDSEPDTVGEFLLYLFGVHSAQRRQKFPKWVVAVTIVTGMVFMATAPDRPSFPVDDPVWMEWGAHYGAVLVPAADASFWWRMFTHLFVHIADWHMAVNVAYLLLFGTLLECRRGTNVACATFLLGGCASAMTALMAASLHPPVASPGWILAGSTGAVYAIAGAYIADQWSNQAPLPDTGVYYLLTAMTVVSMVVPLGVGDGPFGRALFVRHLGGLLFGLLVAVRWLPGVPRVPTQNWLGALSLLGMAWFGAVQPLYLAIFVPLSAGSA